MTSTKDAARAAEANPVLRTLARAGYAANGVVHALIGVIVLAVASGAGGESDQSGAFKAIAAAPAGFVALWVLAVALGALGIWHGVAAVPAHASDPAKKWGRRVSEAGQAVVFLALGVIAGAVALGAEPSGDDAARSASSGVLAVPGGPFLLGAVGLGVAIAGVAFVVMGVRRSFRNKMTIPGGTVGRLTTALGVFGFIAKGIALFAVGVLLVVAAVRVDPEEAGGLDGAVAALLGLPLGPWLVASIGIGFIAYGVFCAFRARYARL